MERVHIISDPTNPTVSVHPALFSKSRGGFLFQVFFKTWVKLLQKAKENLAALGLQLLCTSEESITRNHAYHANRRIRGTGGQKCWFLNQKKQSTSQENVASKKKILWLHMRHSQNRKEQTPRYIYIYNYI